MASQNICVTCRVAPATNPLYITGSRENHYCDKCFPKSGNAANHYSGPEIISQFFSPDALKDMDIDPLFGQQPRCFFCKTETSNLKICSKCKSVSYCSRDCQRQDWKLHKKYCEEKNFPPWPRDLKEI